MQINLTQSEIETAIKNYISSFVVVNDKTQINIELRTTRNPAGCNATVTVESGIINTKSVTTEENNTEIKEESSLGFFNH